MSEKVDQHSLVAAVQELAMRLGRTPKRDEFVREGRGLRDKIMLAFGSYTTLLQAAGLEPEIRRQSFSNEIFEQPLERVLSQHEALAPVVQAKYVETLVIGDTHFPFVDQRILEAILKYADARKPKRIVQIGDLYDMYGASKFPKSLNIYKPQEEEELGRKGAEEMWAALRRSCPAAECIQLKGNHDVRPVKRTLERDPHSEHIVAKHINQLMSFEGVRLIEDQRQEFVVDGIQFIHGYRSRLGDHAVYAHMHSVCGHSHKGGVQFKRIRGQTLWELNAGYCGDAESKALGYTPQRITDWTPGFGWIDEDGPRFVPL